MNFWGRLLTIDRRWIFLVLAIAVTYPLIKPFNMEIDITEESRQFYAAVDRLPEGSTLLISFDHGPSAVPELQPVAEGVIQHAFKKNVKVITIALWPDGLLLSQQVIRGIADSMGKKYGEDYVTLGYYSGVVAGITQIGSNIKTAFPKDANGTPTDQIPMLRNITNYSDIAMVLGLTAGDSADWWIALANGRFHARVVLGCTAVMASDYYAYLQTKQLDGLIGGLKAAGEYQKLVTGDNTKEMYRRVDAQSMIHLVIVSFVILGNVGYFLSRKKKIPAGGKGKG
ncbi:MAG: hypothetical protein ACREJQ_08940 [bacterium]